MIGLDARCVERALTGQLGDRWWVNRDVAVPSPTAEAPSSSPPAATCQPMVCRAPGSSDRDQVARTDAPGHPSGSTTGSSRASAATTTVVRCIPSSWSAKVARSPSRTIGRSVPRAGRVMAAAPRRCRPCRASDRARRTRSSAVAGVVHPTVTGFAQVAVDVAGRASRSVSRRARLDSAARLSPSPATCANGSRSRSASSDSPRPSTPEPPSSTRSSGRWARRVVVCAADGTITLTNPAGERLFPDVDERTYADDPGRAPRPRGRRAARLGRAGGPIELPTRARSGPLDRDRHLPGQRRRRPARPATRRSSSCAT